MMLISFILQFHLLRHVMGFHRSHHILHFISVPKKGALFLQKNKMTTIDVEFCLYMVICVVNFNVPKSQFIIKMSIHNAFLNRIRCFIWSKISAIHIRDCHFCTSPKKCLGIWQVDKNGFVPFFTVGMKKK